MNRSQGNQNGFTIIELMIATMVLSVLLVMVTVVMIGITNLYYKGINQSRVQANVRSITAELSEQLQTNDGYVTASDGTNRSICIGDQRYTYVVGAKIGTEVGNTAHVLWRDKNPEPGGCPDTGIPNMASSTPSSGGAELIAPNSRLTSFEISGTSPYTITVGVAYGDIDLSTAPAGDVRCLGAEGRSFCATARLQTTVVKRLKTN